MDPKKQNATLKDQAIADKNKLNSAENINRSEVDIKLQTPR